MAVVEEELDRRRDLVLAAFALGGSIDILEDLGRKRVTADVREIRRRVVGLLDDLGE